MGPQQLFKKVSFVNIKCDCEMLTTDIDIFKLLSNSHGLMKITWLPLEVVMSELCQSGGLQRLSPSQTFSVCTMQGRYGENKKEIRK